MGGNEFYPDIEARRNQEPWESLREYQTSRDKEIYVLRLEVTSLRGQVDQLTEQNAALRSVIRQLRADPL